MSTPEIVDYQEILERDSFESFRTSVQDAIPKEILSKRGGKLLQVMEADGEYFVRRDYSSEAVRRLSKDSGFEFPTAWEVMQDIHDKAGIPLIPSVLLPYDCTLQPGGVSIVSKFIENPTPVIDTPLAAKEDFAAGLGKLLLHPGRTYLYTSALQYTNFAGDPQADNSKIINLDVDPRVCNRSMLYTDQFSAARDTWNSNYINTISNLLWDECTKEGEREAVFRNFVQNLVEGYNDIVRGGLSKTAMAFSIAHFMANEHDTRKPVSQIKTYPTYD